MTIIEHRIFDEAHKPLYLLQEYEGEQVQFDPLVEGPSPSLFIRSRRVNNHRVSRVHWDQFQIQLQKVPSRDHNSAILNWLQRPRLAIRTAGLERYLAALCGVQNAGRPLYSRTFVRHLKSLGREFTPAQVQWATDFYRRHHVENRDSGKFMVGLTVGHHAPNERTNDWNRWDGNRTEPSPR